MLSLFYFSFFITICQYFISTFCPRYSRRYFLQTNPQLTKPLERIKAIKSCRSGLISIKDNIFFSFCIGISLLIQDFFKSAVGNTESYLRCPSVLSIPINTPNGRTIDLEDFVLNGNASFSPSRVVTLNASTVNIPLKVKISVLYGNETLSACTFLIYTNGKFIA